VRRLVTAAALLGLAGGGASAQPAPPADQPAPPADRAASEAAAVDRAAPGPAATTAPAGADLDDVDLAILGQPTRQPDQRPAIVDSQLANGADVAALGGELTPRRFGAPRQHTEVSLTGYFRARGDALYNLDLDRGLDSAGQPLFPIPLGGGQWLDGGDTRLRTDLAIYSPRVGAAVKARIDWLDQLTFGGDAEAGTPRASAPSGSPGQRAVTAIAIKRAWGELLTPLGVLAVGRMGAHFGLGILANGGDCEDCDGGDAADRVAFVAPVVGHLLAVSWDASAAGASAKRPDGHAIDLEPSDDVSTWTLALLQVATPATRIRRALAGRTTVEYGAFVSRRRQDRDVPAAYLPGADGAIGPGSLIARDFTALSAGAWLRVLGPRYRVEAEIDHLRATVGQPSLIPGVELDQEATSRQLGAAVETEVALGPALVGVNAGYASGDDAPGFGAFPDPTASSTPPGALDGPQADFPADTTVDNFRFSPDYHIDEILFRRIIGTVTDAAYLRPHARVRLASVGHSHLSAGLAVVASWAIEGRSTPTGARRLGVELDPDLRLSATDDWSLVLSWAFLLPGPAFAAATGDARAAHALRARLEMRF
jgi:uncharacterized protein (TIGR04551 family)